MTRVRYHGPHRSVTVHGQRVARGRSIDVPDKVAASLVSGSSWSKVAKPKEKKTKKKTKKTAPAPLDAPEAGAGQVPTGTDDDGQTTGEEQPG